MNVSSKVEYPPRRSNSLNIKKFIETFRKEFNKLPFEDIAFPRGVKGMTEYDGKLERKIYKKATPIHVKGSLIFNHLLKNKKIKFIQPIMDGDKIKFAYLKMPNLINESVIACPDELPVEFNLDKYIDREKQFEKAFVEPIKSITEVINWNISQQATLENFFA